ncbi:MAG: hypothetical protein JRJ54_04920 [Deltaproteobacteria bacterium]|nr:hypothetical protein [Deltaproteobacteria bacterium]
MKIEDSRVALQSEAFWFRFHQRQETLILTAPNPREPAPSDGKAKAKPAWNPGADTVSLSTEAGRTRKTPPRKCPSQAEAMCMRNLNIRILVHLVERLTGKKLHILNPVPETPAAGGGPLEIPEETTPADSRWGVEIRVQEIFVESEATAVTAAGWVETADGRRIDISVSLSMSRTFIETNDIHIQAGQAAKDPLIVSFEGTPPRLLQADFAFDIDCDGSPDPIRFPAPGVGFLAMDQNGDGIINDGSELFGPRTGSGFQELATHDADENGWIDANDPVYDRLRIWTRTPQGENRLFALGEKGIGAVCLDHVSSPFALTDPENGRLGQIRESGIFLSESGQAGILQELDLVV